MSTRLHFRFEDDDIPRLLRAAKALGYDTVQEWGKALLLSELTKIEKLLDGEHELDRYGRLIQPRDDD